ncbi:hypothetical protein [Synechococcus elongatus]|uniref:Pyridine nucleotide-disulphide oxidoreductase dimerisation domain-containing protein n=2 Tax=Synechococcus elongatus TaxID=32046 RepID=Q31PU4_SYNE7|nr:hypothetical protein [Synechococcus elongatus]ABB56925.1 conserved hypothetical protein [Synechococcus elongatus PCC 7942 = FACHB-805]AJD58547.1 hypothetical protein M744_12260 [Synechococcus elongatus UTEX 2973]MBD2587328.1 hypothetical protein [Synechococcus elongatus FACHB-242]MBD2688892.1 hypothetical protein [Synechococcus elongatus FACHB-1061]MBD2707964.1 hypothetical protein [Synechococcus elongatus PCC 7942 = FACHB-805]
MTADYNLLILGATPAAIALAQQARRWQARVALIYLPESWGAIDRDRLLMRCLLKSTSVPEALASGQALYERLELLQGPIALQQQGIDIVASHWKATRSRRVVDCSDRRLEARQIWQAQPTGAEATPLWDLLTADPQPQSVTVTGDRTIAIGVAQALTRHGWDVGLATPAIWSSWEPTIVQRLQAQCQAEGIHLLEQSTRQTDSCELSLNYFQPDPLPLLPGSRAIAANLSPAEVRAIAQHGLFGWPRQQSALAPQQVLEMDPAAAQVGLTEAQARRRYGDRVELVTASWQQHPEALIRDQTAGFLQLCVLNNGRLLGASWVADNAGDLVAPLSLAIQTRRSLPSLLGLWPESSLGQALEQLLADWEVQRNQRSWRRRLLSEWQLFWRSTF